MAFRRKLKRILLMMFFTTILVKIHYDYRALNSMNENGMESRYFNLNDSSQVRVITLKNIKDILIAEDDLNSNQRKTLIAYTNKVQESSVKSVDETKPASRHSVKVENKESHNRNSANEEENKNQIDSSHLDVGGSNDSRIYYNPSFRKKMEEAFRQKMELYKLSKNAEKLINEINQWDSNGRPSELPKPDDDNEKGEKLDVHRNEAQSINNNKYGPPTPLKPEQHPRTSHPILKLNRTEMMKRLTNFRKRMNVARGRNNKSKVVTAFKLSHVVDVAEISLNATEIARIKREIENLNEKQIIYNRKTFGSPRPNDTVIMIQVHNRLENLKYLVQSLSEVKYIKTTLVIFSHDFWDENINRFVRNINSFRVMQIFFPFSIQLNPSSFPGRDPRDCQWNQNDGKSKLPKGAGLDCLNKKWSDTYGHYREAAFTQIKHHWWWKVVRVFDHLRDLRNFTGQVLFLEEDHYVVPDILHVLRLIVKARERSYKSHLVIGLGNYQRYTSTTSNTVERGDWVVNRYNLGFAFDRRAYNIMKKCQKDFCNYDDYNWDWTMAYMAKTCAQRQFSMLSLKLSRVLHIGSCGTHVRKGNCNLDKEVSVAKTRISSFKSKLFPSSLSVQKNFKGVAKPKKPNGGWGDLRDRQLCLSIINGTNIDQTLEKLQFHGERTSL